MNKPGRPGFIWIRLDCCCCRRHRCHCFCCCCCVQTTDVHKTFYRRTWCCTSPHGVLELSHRHSNGLDAILDIKVSKLSALGRSVSLQLESREARKTKFILMCPKEMATHYQYSVHQLNVSALLIMAVFHWTARVLLGRSFVFVPNIQ